jgi:predicted DNA-binding protein
VVTAEDHALSVRLPQPLYEQLRRFAFERHIAQAVVIREALERFLSEGDQRAEPSR